MDGTRHTVQDMDAGGLVGHWHQAGRLASQASGGDACVHRETDTQGPLLPTCIARFST